ncbi:MAG: hypothetical protein R2857_05050 [Vampirovibrionales bacterium]
MEVGITFYGNGDVITLAAGIAAVGRDQAAATPPSVTVAGNANGTTVSGGFGVRSYFTGGLRRASTRKRLAFVPKSTLTDPPLLICRHRWH